MLDDSLSAVKIIAGPCSVDFDNKKEIKDSLKIKYKGKIALYGVRIVGLKSRTSFDPKNAFIGIDLEKYEANCNNAIMQNSNTIDIAPSIEIANEIQGEFQEIFMATEVVDPWMQCRIMSKYLNSNRLIIWNPAVNHLGFLIQIMAKYAKAKQWKIGIKNGKSLGSNIDKSENKNIETSLDKSWIGLASYANCLHEKDILMIHRGVDLGENQGFRNFPVHNLCKRVKAKSQLGMFLDPSHILGPKMRSDIVNFTIESMKIKSGDGYLYNGILLECGTSKSDTDQHINHSELEEIVAKVSHFRQIYHE